MANKKRDIIAQPGYLVVKWVEPKAVSEDLITRDSGIILSGKAQAQVEKEATHKEHVVVSSSKESLIKAGETVITSKVPAMIRIEVDNKEYGILAEDEVVARLIE